MERKPFKGPDLNAARQRKDGINLIAYPDEDRHGFFAAAKEQYPSLAELTNKQIAGVIKAILKHYADEVVNNRHGVKLPGGLGAVVTGLSELTNETSQNNIDYNTSKQLGFVVRHLNSQTNGLLAKIYYTANTYGCKLKSYRVTFKPCRNIKRKVSAIMKSESSYRRYIITHPKWSITNIFRKPKTPKQTWRQKKADREELERQWYLKNEYDEFEGLYSS